MKREPTPERFSQPRERGRSNGGSGGLLLTPEEEVEESKTLSSEMLGPETPTYCPSSIRVKLPSTHPKNRTRSSLGFFALRPKSTQSEVPLRTRPQLSP
eukprot:435978-Pyramimonas_sp.AAC.1